MYFVCFQRVVKAYEEVYQFMEIEQKLFLLSRLLYGLVQIRNTSSRREKGRVKLQELSPRNIKTSSRKMNCKLQNGIGFYRGKLSLTTPRTSMLLVFYKRKTRTFLLQQWDYQQSSVLLGHGGALGTGQLPGTAACSQQSQQRDQLPSDPAQAISAVLTGCAQLQSRDTGSLWSSWSWSEHPLETGQEFLLCPSSPFRLSSSTGSYLCTYTQPVIFHGDSQIVS